MGEFKPTVGMGCFFKDIPVKPVSARSVDFGEGQAFLCQRTVPGTKEVYNDKKLAWETVPCELIEESIIWEKDLTEKAAGKPAK